MTFHYLGLVIHSIFLTFGARSYDLKKTSLHQASIIQVSIPRISTAEKLRNKHGKNLLIRLHDKATKQVNYDRDLGTIFFLDF